METKKLLRVSILSLVVCHLLSSCESDYDLTKKINGDITIGGSELAFPIGTSEKIVADKLLNLADENILITSENGDYYISMKDDVKHQKFSIPNITMNSVTPTTKPLTFSTTRRVRSNFGLTTLTFSIPEPINFSVVSPLPQEIISISTSEFKKSDTGTYPTLDISIKFSGIPENIPTLSISNITLDLPDEMTYVADKEIIGKQLIASGEVALSGGAGEYTKIVQITGLNLSETTSDRSININQDLNLQGTITIAPIGGVDIDIDLIKGNPSIYFSGAQLNKIKAIIDANIPPLSFIYITEFPEFIKSEGTYLDILNAAISINAITNSPAAIKAETEITSYHNEVYIENSKIDLSIDINPSKNDNEMETSLFWISDSNEKAPQSYTWIDRDISSIIRNLPETINFIINPQTSKAPTTIELGREYGIEFNYKFVTPLMLGEKLTINYDKEFTNIQEELTDVIDKISALIFDIEIDNHVPLDMIISPVPLDIDGKIVVGVDITIDGDVKSAEKDTTNKITGTKGVKSNTKLTIKEIEKGSLKNINTIKMNIKSHSNKQTMGAMLNKNQFIILSMKAKIPNGINLNLN